MFGHCARVKGIEVRGGHGRPVEHLHQMGDRGGMRHQGLAIFFMEGNDREFKINTIRIFGRQLMNFRNMDIADRKHRDAFVGVLEEILQPLHGLRMQKEIRPFHILVAAPHPILVRPGRLFADVVEDVIPLVLGSPPGLLGLPIGMIDFITKGAFDGAGLADTDGNFPLVHLLA